MAYLDAITEEIINDFMSFMKEKNKKIEEDKSNIDDCECKCSVFMKTMKWNRVDGLILFRSIFGEKFYNHTFCITTRLEMAIIGLFLYAKDKEHENYLEAIRAFKESVSNLDKVLKSSEELLHLGEKDKNQQTH